MNTYTYDAANRLISITQSPNHQIEYRYNGLNDRLQETVNGSTTTFTMDLNTGLTQALSEGTYTYLYGYGRIAQLNTDTPMTDYFLGDALGSVRQLADTQGRITLAKAYNPYGEVTQSAGAGQSGYGYTGEYHDSYNQLVYLRARHYAPSMGRFLTKDTWSGDVNRPGSLNRWNYVEGNPIIRVDPTGLSYVSDLYGLNFFINSKVTKEAWNSENINAVELAVIIVGNAITREIDAQYGIEYGSIYEEASNFRKVFGIKDDNLMGFEWRPLCENCHPSACNKSVNGKDNYWDTRYEMEKGKIKIDKNGNKILWIIPGTGVGCECNATGGFTVSAHHIQFATLSPNLLNRINNVIHEMGHAFNNRTGAMNMVVAEPYKTINGESWKMNSRPFGFHPEEQPGRRWQQSKETDRSGSEVFADMFLGWAYDKWADDIYGDERAKFMKIHMKHWIFNAMSR